MTPDLMREAQDLLNDPTKQYKCVGILRLEKTVRDKLTQDARDKVLAEERELVGRMYMRGLIRQPQDALTVDVLTEALCWSQNYCPALGLMIGGNREVSKVTLLYLRTD